MLKKIRQMILVHKMSCKTINTRQETINNFSKLIIHQNLWINQTRNKIQKIYHVQKKSNISLNEKNERL